MTRAQGSGIPTHVAARHARVRAAMAGQKLDSLLLTSPADLGYVTGISWDDSVGVLTHDRLAIVSDSRYDEEIGMRCPWLPRNIFKGTKTIADGVVDLLFKFKAGRVGFEQNFITHGMVLSLQEKVRGKKTKGSRPRVMTQNGLMVGVRAVKDAVEIETIRRAIACAQDAYRKIRSELRVGDTENHIAGRLEYEMRAAGASKGSFETNVSAGANSSLPHYRPHDDPVRADSALLFDWGAVVGGYCSDLTRTHMVGKAPEKLAEIYKVVLEAQMAAIGALRPGLTTRKADKVARDVISKAGYGKYFGHGLGHGIGLAIHEAPRVGRVAKAEPLKEGMVVTVEPGIYLPGLGGVRIEDDVLITKTGCEVLSCLDKTFEGCHIE